MVNQKSLSHNQMFNPLLPKRGRNKAAIFTSFFIIAVQQLSGIPAVISYAYIYSFNAIPDKLYFPTIFFLIMAVTSQIFPTLI